MHWFPCDLSSLYSTPSLILFCLPTVIMFCVTEMFHSTLIRCKCWFTSDCYILIQFFNLSNKSPHKTKKRGALFSRAAGRQNYFLFPSSPFPSCGIPEAGGPVGDTEEESAVPSPSLGPVVSKHTALLNQMAISSTTWHFLCLQQRDFNYPKLKKKKNVKNSAR